MYKQKNKILKPNSYKTNFPVLKHEDHDKNINDLTSVGLSKSHFFQKQHYQLSCFDFTVTTKFSL